MVITSTPLRVSFFGGGTDYPVWYREHGGSVLATTQAYTTPSLTATSTYCVAATDSAYVPATATANATVTVSSAALSVTITPGSPTVDSGQSVQLTAHPAGGTGPYTYTWYEGLACSGEVLGTSRAYTTGR